jgi:hypothetical protein
MYGIFVRTRFCEFERVHGNGLDGGFCGQWCGGLAEDWFAQQQEASEKEQKREEAEYGARCGHTNSFDVSQCAGSSVLPPVFRVMEVA